MNSTKVIIIMILLMVIVIVWYFNVHFIRSIQSQQTKLETPDRETFFASESLPKFDFVYKNVKRDPFRVIVETVAKTTEPIPPRFYLRGVVLAKDGAIALIEMPNGNVYTMKKGEEYMGAKIKKITPKSVVLNFRGHEIILNVWE